MKENDRELFTGLTMLRAPAYLRSRVLDVAGRENHRAPPPPTMIDRVWENRLLRVAWGVAASVLLACNLLLMPRHQLPDDRHQRVSLEHTAERLIHLKARGRPTIAESVHAVRDLLDDEFLTRNNHAPREKGESS